MSWIVDYKTREDTEWKRHPTLKFYSTRREAEWDISFRAKLNPGLMYRVRATEPHEFVQQQLAGCPTDHERVISAVRGIIYQAKKQTALGSPPSATQKYSGRRALMELFAQLRPDGPHNLTDAECDQCYV